jgi:hypothetical protein
MLAARLQQQPDATPYRLRERPPLRGASHLRLVK